MNLIELKAVLASLGWSQRELARRLDCDQDTVSRWCTGKTRVPGHVVEYFRVLQLAQRMLS